MILTNFTLDLILLIYTAVLTYYVIRIKRNSGTHRIDRNFTLVLIPYITLISLTSATISIEKTVINTFILTSTAITILTACLTRIENYRIAYITEIVTGFIAVSLLFLQIKPVLDVFIFLQMLIFTTAAFFPIYIIHLLKEQGKISLYLFPIFTHFLDAGSTVIALQEGLKESRLLAQIFIKSMGNYGIFIMKALIIVPIAYYIKEEVKGEISREVLYMIGIYGLVLGLRNYFLILM